MKDTDYQFIFELVKVDNPMGVSIWGAIRMLAESLTGTLSATYRTLGGSLLINQAAVYQYSISHILNRNVAYAALVPYR